MDPNTTLEVIRQAIHNRAIVEHFTALDEWLSRGGFLPDAWARSDVIREIKAEAWDEGYGRGGADHCDYWPSHEGCEVSSPNPYLPYMSPERGGEVTEAPSSECRFGYVEHDGYQYCHEHGGLRHYVERTMRCDRALGEATP